MHPNSLPPDKIRKGQIREVWTRQNGGVTQWRDWDTGEYGYEEWEYVSDTTPDKDYKDNNGA